MRGDVYELPAPRDAVGHEQQGRRYCVAVQSDAMWRLSTVIVCPTSTRAQPASWRPEVEFPDGSKTYVVTEQARVVDPTRLGRQVGRLSFADMLDIDRALRIVLGL